MERKNLTFITLNKEELNEIISRTAVETAKQFVKFLPGFNNGREFISVTEAAEILAVSGSTISNWVRSGVLSGKKTGGRLLISYDSVMHYTKNI